MNYVFEIKIYTDGDFGFQFVPRGMKYDGGYEYTFEKAYSDRDKAIEDVVDICSFLKSYMHTSRDYVKEDWSMLIDNFVKHLRESSESVYERIEEYMSGNYEGTEFVFRAEAQRVNCSFSVTDEEFEMIRNNYIHVTHSMIKEAVLALYSNHIKE